MSLAYEMLLQIILVLIPFLATDKADQALYPYHAVLGSNTYQYLSY